jgi:hypothetical protein
MAYKQRSNGLPFKQMGSSPAKHYVDDNREHNTPEHSDDLQTPEEHKTGKVESPAKQKVTKGGVKKGRSQTPGPIVADTRISTSDGTSKKIGPVESPESIKKKRANVTKTRKTAEASGKSGTIFDSTKETREANFKASDDYKEAKSYSKD